MAAPVPTASSRRLRALNAALEGAWRGGWADVPSLAPDRLVAKAVAHAGVPVTDGAGPWRERLELLCADLESTARLSALGRTIAHGQLVGALSARFRAAALWRAHPEIANVPVRAPILVVGQMRSGTTRMQRLLACDPRLTFTRFYESWNPIPRRVGAAIDGRKLRGRLALATVRLLNPRFRAIHPTRWDAADEEIGLQSLSIFGAAFEAQWRVPRFAALVEDADARPAYHEFRHLLQTLAWLRGGADDRPWVLKVPQFSQDLVALLDVFPDARVVVVRRDAPTVIASAASLVGNQMRIQSDHVDAEWIGREWTRKVRLREDRTTAALAASSAPRVVIDYAEVGADWAREMRRVYAMLGLTLPDPVRTRMQDYVTRTAAGRRPAHVYAPAALDLAPA